MKSSNRALSKITYAFIDSQNLNLGIRELGWKLDFQKFLVYLKDKYKVKEAFSFAPSRKLESSLIRRFRDYKLYVEDIRPKVEFKSKKMWASH